MLALVTLVGAQGIKPPYQAPEQFHHLFPPIQDISPLVQENPSLFNVESRFFKDTVLIDFEKRQIMFLQYDSYTGLPLWQYHFAEFEHYFSSIWEFTRAKLWYEREKTFIKKDEKSKQPPKLELVAPIHYPAWARRVLGNEPPKLSIKGFQTIEISIGRRKLQRGDQIVSNTGGFDFDHNNMFTIEGSIGRLISIQIKTGKDVNEEMDFTDQLKKFKIEYKADPDSANQLEDEIIQEVVVGYTNFQMPGQGLAGYSESHEGLFGVKMRTQWGPLSLTKILSREKVETQKDTLHISGGAITGFRKQETDFMRNAFFFLDSIYLKKYLDPDIKVPQIKDLRVYLPVTKDEEKPDDQYAYIDTTNNALRFRKLTEYIDYTVDYKNGWIFFKDSLGSRPDDEDIVGIFMVASDPNLNKGDTTIVGHVDNGKFPIFKNLWVLKNKRSDSKPSTDSTYFLMWRNVYALDPNARPEDFTLEVFRKTSKGEREKNNLAGDLYAHILKLTDGNGNAEVGDDKIFNFIDKYMVLPPFDNDTIGNQPFRNPALGKSLDGSDNSNKEIYLDASAAVSNFEFVSTGKSKVTTFNLFGIVENSETIKTPGGLRLEKDVDYYIEYDWGQITLISQLALSNDQLYIEYQQQSLFMFESRTFLGAHAKLDLPGIGKNSYLATSVMGQFVNAKDLVPKVGNEPFNRFLIDANMHFEFEPQWMTTLVNAIPFITTTSTSSAAFDIEAAYSGVVVSDKDRNQGNEAYIDNFESSQRDYPLGGSHTDWDLASPSVDLMDSLDFIQNTDTTQQSVWLNPPVWNSYWYTPITGEQTRREEVWALTEEDIESENLYLNTMRLTAQVLPENKDLVASVVDTNNIAQINPWAGIMQSIPVSLQDRSDDAYLEFWIKTKKGEIGNLYVDMGEVSEDLAISGALPNRRNNKEKKDMLVGEISDDVYDLGLDTLADSAETYYYPDYANKTYTLLKKGDSRLGKFINDPARDNYAEYTVGSEANKSKVNGKEDDNRLSTEDINGDGGLNLNESFFRFKVDLANIDSSVFVDKSKKAAADSARWFFVRIPVNEVTKKIEKDTMVIGKPSWDRIRFVRFLWTDFTDSTAPVTSTLTDSLLQLEFMDIKFAGNYWEAEKVSQDSTSDTIPGIVATVAVEGEHAHYKKPYYKLVEKDDNGNEKKDQSLLIKYKNLGAGQNVFVTKENRYQKMDLTEYSEIRVYVRDSLYTRKGTFFNKYEQKADKVNEISQSDIYFVFRFGNHDSSYYEFKTKNISQAQTWDSPAGIRILLGTFSELKLKYLELHGNNVLSIDTTLLVGTDTYRIFSTTGALPSFSNIGWMALGVERDSSAQEKTSGELWVNALRVKGIDDKKGYAFRTSFSTKWADFMNTTATLDYDDADFRQMSEAFQGEKHASIRGGIRADWMLNKFLPDRWGVSIPVGIDMSASLARPKRRPGTDILLTDEHKRPDQLNDMAKDFVDLIFNNERTSRTTKAEHYESNAIKRSWYTNYSKSIDSKNPLLNLTVDRISTNLSYTFDSTTQREGEIAQIHQSALSRDHIGQDHVNVKAARTYYGKLQYDLTPKKSAEKTSWSPFQRIQSDKFPDFLKEYTFHLLPSRFNFNLIEGTFSRNYTYRSLEEVLAGGLSQRVQKTLFTEHGFQYSHAPIEPILETNFDLAFKRNYDKILAQNIGLSKYDIFEKYVLKFDPVWEDYGVTFAEQSRNQNASLRFDPRLFDWLDHSVDYSSRYAHTPKIKAGKSYLTTTIASDFVFKSNFRIRTLFNTLNDLTEKVKAINTPISLIEKGIDKIDFTAVDFEYKASLNLTNNFLSRELVDSRFNENPLSYLGYQLGIADRSWRRIVTGDMNDVQDFGGMQYRVGKDASDNYKDDSRVTNQEYSFGTRFRLASPLNIGFDPVSFGWKRRFSVRPDLSFMDTLVTFPIISVNANSTILEQIPIVKQLMQRLSLQSGFTYQKEAAKSYFDITERSIKIDETRRKQWAPLIGVNGTFKARPVTLSYGFGHTVDSTITRIENSSNDTAYGGKNKIAYTHKLTVSYTIPGKPDREIRLFNRWAIPIKGNLDLNFDAEYNTYYDINEALAADEREMKSWEFLLHPYMKYYFTDNIEGSMEYTYAKGFKDFNQERKSDNTFKMAITIFFK